MQRIQDRATDDRYSYVTFFHYFKALELSYAAHGISSPERLIDAMKRLNPNISRKKPISDDNGNRLRQYLFQSCRTD